MKQGRQYTLQLDAAPGITPHNWAQISYPDAMFQVEIKNVQGNVVRIYALVHAPDPVPGRDELVYRHVDPNQTGERRTITAFAPV